MKIVLFLLGSAPIILLSWRSLRDWRSYRFFRFFAFESLLALTLLNIDTWFFSPWSITQILSWILLTSSAFLALHGFALLRQVGRPQGSIEATTVLVIRGAYKYIRHPLYASLLYFAWGVFLKGRSMEAVLLVSAVSVFLYLTARAEERENLTKFGERYAEYMGRTKMFLPLFF